MGDTVVQEAVQRTLDWAEAMQEWLTKYESHVKKLVEDKELPRPPQW